MRDLDKFLDLITEEKSPQGVHYCDLSVLPKDLQDAYFQSRPIDQRPIVQGAIAVYPIDWHLFRSQVEKLGLP